ncbi:MAG: peroxiredoxin [Rhodocyclales bacterium CG17_big_fil_post_rev_8_21_14_2_50_68_7]|nr:MAG: peroxiredoxin [Betaproteobacteria bacterium CG2_30_68_42]PIV72237.1 MAG: peroxiredoxin [Rhodocyclales bacterium CG17_big_fil_post_rev_8_21_14_2_50_68_7]PIX75615.1 MAG: peroxiredoxin [Rhodocyclales bacterium CG_4_10_14_3_um_filter_68_10]PJA57350.1 MAG: peroxiredoxin [Rhodocyclales bacterium CG_4_9_14_3_um_filter_68_10]
MEGKPVPDFTLPATGGASFSPQAARGTPFVLYFYPKDATPGCTTEAQQFRDLHGEFARLGCAIFGISRDSLASHDKFKAKLGLPFELLSDADETACAQFGVIKLKNLYGKKVRGIERSTFAIDAGGIVRRAWRGVKVPDHAAEVLAFVKTL